VEIPRPGACQLVPISRIKIDEGRRDAKKARGIADSIREVGLLHPITITADHTLIGGRNRVEAFKLLGQESIPAVILEVEGLRRELAAIDENLVRDELTILERGEQTARRKVIYEQLHPEVKTGGLPGKSGGGKVAKSATVAPFAQDTAAKTGTSTRTIHEDVQIANRITPEAKALIRGTPLADEKRELLRVARLPAAKQEKVIKAAQKDGTTIAQAQRQVERAERTRKMKATAQANGGDEAASPTLQRLGWEVREGDCITLLGSIPEKSARLVFCDLPYNQGVDYGEGPKADRLRPDVYVTWCRSWIEAARDCLTDDGSLWLLINHENAARLEFLLCEARLTIINWITWYETFGVNQVNKCNRTSRRLLHAVVNPRKYVWNHEAVTRLSDRRAKYDDSRANPDGKMWDDVWIIPRLTGTWAERIEGFPTQLPLALLGPIVAVASDEGDLVVEPMSGSSTAGVAAIRRKRRYVGIEKNPEYCEKARQRLSAEGG
jgi:DNA modification methylase/ParB-like chromosome segregation protein Spo0J